MTLDAWVPCIRCGKPSAPHGEHHEPAKGMGGATKHVEHPNVPVCRACHQAVHAKAFALMVSGDFVSTWENGRCVSERALLVNDGAQDKRYWSDEALAIAWGQVLERVTDLLQDQCELAWQFECRYSWADYWEERAADIIREWTGHSASGRDVRRKAALHHTFHGRWDDYALLGTVVSISVAESAEPEAALEFASLQIAGGGQTKTAIAEQVHDKFGKQGTRSETCECPACGARHRKKTGG